MTQAEVLTPDPSRVTDGEWVWFILLMLTIGLLSLNVLTLLALCFGSAYAIWFLSAND